MKKRKTQLRKWTQTALEFIAILCVILIISSIDNLFVVKGYIQFVLTLIGIGTVCSLIIKKYGRKED